MNGWIEERAKRLGEFLEVGPGAELVGPEQSNFELGPETMEGLTHFNIEWHVIPSAEAAPLDEAYLKRLYPLAPRDFRKAHEQGPSYRDRITAGHRQHQGRIIGVETTQKPRYLPGNRQFYGTPYGHDATADPFVAYLARVQSGTPLLLTSGRLTYNANTSATRVDSGVVLYNINTNQLNSLVKIRKDPSGVVYWLPQNIIDNTLAAFETGGKTLADLKANEPYIGPPTTAGELGARIYLYGPWQKRIDLNVIKKTRVNESVSMELRAQFINAFNYQNFFIGTTSTNNPVLGGAGIGSQFGQTRTAYRDITVSGTNDPGGRLIEFQLRLNF